jgi:heavy metal sensor kinase
MIPRWSTLSIRARLTAWYAGVLALILIVYASTTFLAVRIEFLEQFDDALRDDLAAAESAISWTSDGRIALARDGHHVAESDGERVYDAWSVNGEPLYRSRSSVGLPPAVATGEGHAVYTSLDVNGEHWRTLTNTVTIGGRAVVSRAARSEELLRHQLGEILMVLALGLPLVVALAGIGGYVLARRALAPIDHLASDAQRITADRLHERLSIANPHDEIGRLAGVINATFARLEASFDQLRRFTADASHELRTPLAVVRGIGEAALADERRPPEYVEAIGSMLEEVDRMAGLVDTLLRLSHGDAGTIRLSREPVDLGHLAREVASSLGILADERNQTLTLDVTEGVIVSADRLVLREAVTNVLDNAIKYGPSGSTIAIQVGPRDHYALLAIRDQGPGIPPEHRERIFHRFFRIDEARSRDRGGAGLGLAIAKWAVEAHDGAITVETRPGCGAEFRIQLPFARI